MTDVEIIEKSDAEVALSRNSRFKWVILPEKAKQPSPAEQIHQLKGQLKLHRIQAQSKTRVRTTLQVIYIAIVLYLGSRYGWEFCVALLFFVPDILIGLACMLFSPNFMPSIHLNDANIAANLKDQRLLGGLLEAHASADSNTKVSLRAPLIVLLNKISLADEGILNFSQRRLLDSLVRSEIE